MTKRFNYIWCLRRGKSKHLYQYFMSILIKTKNMLWSIVLLTLANTWTSIHGKRRWVSSFLVLECMFTFITKKREYSFFNVKHQDAQVHIWTGLVYVILCIQVGLLPSNSYSKCSVVNDCHRRLISRKGFVTLCQSKKSVIPVFRQGLSVSL